MHIRNRVFREHWLSFWGLQFGYMVGQGCLWDQPPVKLQTESLSVPGRQHLPPLSQLTVGGVKRFPCDQKTTAASVHQFPQELAQAPLRFMDFALFPFTIINHGLEQDDMLSPGTFPSESPNPGVTLGPCLTQPVLCPQLQGHPGLRWPGVSEGNGCSASGKS